MHKNYWRKDMSDEEKKPSDLPGLVFHHRGSKRFEVAGKQKAEVRLEADVNDEEVWADILKKFIEGFPIYTVLDFQGEMVEAFRSEVKELEGKNIILERQVERLEREKALLTADLEKIRAPLAALGKRLSGV